MTGRKRKLPQTPCVYASTSSRYEVAHIFASFDQGSNDNVDELVKNELLRLKNVTDTTPSLKVAGAVLDQDTFITTSHTAPQVALHGIQDALYGTTLKMVTPQVSDWDISDKDGEDDESLFEVPNSKT